MYVHGYARRVHTSQVLTAWKHGCQVSAQDVGGTYLEEDRETEKRKNERVRIRDKVGKVHTRDD